MAVASKSTKALPFVLRARSPIGSPAALAPEIDSPTPLAETQALLEATRADLLRLSAAQEQLFALLQAREDGRPAGGRSPATVPRLEGDDAEAPALEFRLFRFFEVRRGQQTADRWTSKKARLLLAYLAMKGDAPATRESLIEMFWPDSLPERGANNLSIAIHQIRARLGKLIPGDDRGIRVEQGTYRLSPGSGASIDVVEFQRHITRGRTAIGAGEEATARDELSAAVALCTGDLLESDPYEEWTIEPRRALAQTYQWALAWLAADAASSGDWGSVLQHGRTMVWRDACNEEGHRLIIQAHGELGNRSEALRQYRECADTLESQIGVGPSPETKALAAAIVGKLSE